MPEHETQNILGGARRRQVNPDHRLPLDDASSDIDEPQAQRIELRDAPHRAPGHRHAQTPHEPICACVQEQPELVGRGLGARGAVGRQMRLPGLDMVFRLAAPAVDILVKYTGVADLQVGDDEACVGPFRAGLHTGDDPLDAAPAGGPVEELLEAARLAFLRRGLEARLRAGLEALDVPAQRRGRRDAQDIIETIGSTPVEDFRTAIMAVGAQQYLGVGPVGPDRQRST